MPDEILGSIPTIVISIIALLGVWYATRGEIRREAAREAQALTLLDAQAKLRACAGELDDLRATVGRLETALATALAENRVLKDILSTLRSSGITVSGGTVNVHGDAVGGDESNEMRSQKRDEYGARGNVNLQNE